MTTTEPARYGGHTLDELEAMEQRATPVPWDETTEATDSAQVECDAGFAFTARNALPDLIAAVKRLTAERDALMAVLDYASDKRLAFSKNDTGRMAYISDGLRSMPIFASGEDNFAALLALAKRIEEANHG